MNVKHGLAVVSGGMDSITMLHQFRSEVGHVLSFYYGSKHNHRELPFATLHAEQFGIAHTTIPLDFVSDHFKSDLLQTGGQIPEGHYADPVMKKTVVPFRNGIMLAIAAGLAESLGYEKIFIANHFGDHAIYPDCRVAFINPMQTAIREGTYARVELVSPYATITKRDIALIGKGLGVPYEHTWSCYKGGDLHCGKCGTCFERREALDGFDPTEYQE